MPEKELKTDIPELFYSDAEGKPFEHCQVCGKSLLEKDSSYVIEKAFKNYKGHDFHSTLFEYAICLKCHMQMQRSMSRESISRLQQYYMGVMAVKSSVQQNLDPEKFELEKFTANCYFTGEPVKEMGEYQIMAQFSGDKMVLAFPPMAVGEHAMEEMAELLSDQTIDELDDFRKKYLGPDPAIESLFSRKKLLLI